MDWYLDTGTVPVSGVKYYIVIFSSDTATIFKPTNQSTSGRLRVGGVGLEIWYIGDDMIFRHGDSYIFQFK